MSSPGAYKTKAGESESNKKAERQTAIDKERKKEERKANEWRGREEKKAEREF